MKEEKRQAGFWLGAVCGGVVSVLATLWFAPKSGSEWRTQSAEWLQRIADWRMNAGQRASLSAVAETSETDEEVGVDSEPVEQAGEATAPVSSRVVGD